MNQYDVSTYTEPQPPKSDEVILIASGDLRLSANQTCWAAQEDMEKSLTEAFAQEGITIKRGHPYDPDLEHGFIWNQRMGIDD